MVPKILYRFGLLAFAAPFEVGSKDRGATGDLVVDIHQSGSPVVAPAPRMAERGLSDQVEVRVASAWWTARARLRGTCPRFDMKGDAYR